MDELAALIDAATNQDVSLMQSFAPIEMGLTAAQVAHLHSQGRSPKQIATSLGSPSQPSATTSPNSV